MTIPSSRLQPVPAAAGSSGTFSDGLIAHDSGMICFLNLERMFDAGDDDWGMVA